MSKYIVGLTGGIGSGKSTIAEMFSQLGIDIIDADIVARNVVQPNNSALKAIVQYFGNNYIQDNGHLNRALLRNRIFSDETDKQWLNDLLHPLIRTQIVEQIKASSSPYCLLVAPLLIENKLTHLVNHVLVIDVSESTQLERTLKRDNSTKTEVEAIIASQCSRDIRINAADDLINNDITDLSQVNTAVVKLHQKYLTLAK